MKKIMIYIENAKRIPVGESRKFIYSVGDERGSERPGLLIHLEDGFVTYDALCTHMQAEVEWNKYTGRFGARHMMAYTTRKLGDHLWECLRSR